MIDFATQPFPSSLQNFLENLPPHHRYYFTFRQRNNFPDNIKSNYVIDLVL